jgi:hypothetical protein
MREVEQQTGGRVRLGPATLYGSLRTLLEASLIEELDGSSGSEDGSERRRYYRLTSAEAGSIGGGKARPDAPSCKGKTHIARGRCLKGSTRFC